MASLRPLRRAAVRRVPDEGVLPGSAATAAAAPRYRRARASARPRRVTRAAVLSVRAGYGPGSQLAAAQSGR